ncbi:MAG: helix-turn-helix domain-containing protein [Pyrinomonadaceae bacterium]|nr:helix-turn-helix domain-containing protein [Pyrinomonadaceae bacterium]
MPYKTNLPRKIISHDAKPKTFSSSRSDWWTPLWRGLTVDPTAKHFRAMGSSVWLYLYLLTFANRTTGNLFRRISTVAGDMGMSSRTISRWLKSLKAGGYIEVRHTGRSLQIAITKWKPINKR